ncbi:hypothetical protein CERSUDRAFT_89993 [Gelatoporia subvermispora B]|uniref:Uncharacterized protein n=1 Tax=Ceriporiopsis subvermispora (strain B) TaxID=914234 RepID=M2RRD4_CERS8|nr:hypothetical protein CERSUDRAFT_89993 [Gelatoporia subvermispora B]
MARDALSSMPASPVKVNEKYRRDRYREELGLAIKASLRELTGNPRARMEWKQYYERIIKNQRVVLEGWPHGEVPFGEPSSYGTSELSRLVGLWRDGTMCLRRISQAEFEVLKAEHDAKVASGEIKPTPPRKPRRDIGHIKIRTNPLTRGKKRRGLVKSKEYIEPEDEPEDESEHEL